MESKEVTAEEVMYSLLTIEHAQRDYLPYNDNHRGVYSMSVNRTIALADTVLQKHGLKADF